MGRIVAQIYVFLSKGESDVRNFEFHIVTYENKDEENEIVWMNEYM